MKLKEMKIKTFSLIEEYYPEVKNMAEDEDVLNKINSVVNQIQIDLMQRRKIPTYIEINVKSNSKKTLYLNDEIDDFYQLNKIKFDKTVDYEMIDDNTLQLPDDYEGKFTIYYYKYPKLVKTVFDGDTEEEKQKNRETEDNNFVFELDTLLLEIMPYGIAADLLKMDMISNYGKHFYERYLEMKNNIDPRRTTGTIRITGGFDI